MMKKDNDFYQSIYSLMKKKLDYRMNEGVEQDLRKFLNHVQDQQHQKEVSKSQTSYLDGPDSPKSEKKGLADPHGRYIP